MTSKKWMVLTALIAVALVAVLALVPMVLAQGPVVDDTTTPGSGFDMPLVQNGLNGVTDGWFGRGWQMQANAATNQMGMGRRGMWQANGQDACPNFVDEDGDGVCDLAGARQGRGPGFVDEDGDGVCDHAGARQGRGPGFVDEDGDGLCDHAGTGQGRGPGFVDEDGDGACDHAGAGQGRRGQGRGSMMGRWAQQAQQTN